MHATAEAGAPERATPTIVPEELSTTLHRVAARLGHAAELARIGADGNDPEWGAELVIDILDSLEDDIARLRLAAAPTAGA